MKRSCGSCGDDYEAVRASSRYCSERCRKRAQRGHRRVAAAEAVPAAVPSAQPAPVESVEDALTAAVRSTLAQVGRDGTYLGALAVSLAARIDASTASMGLAPLAQQLRTTMEAALEGTGQTVDALDELRARRDRKRAG